MLWLIKKSLYPFLLVLLVLYSPLPCIAASQMYSISAEQLTEMETNLIALESNIETLSTELKMSNDDLTIALTALSALKEQYIQARGELSTVKKSLTIAESELDETKQYVGKLEKTQQKLHDIKIGAAYIYNDIYGSISYRNRALTYSILYAKSGKAGFEIEYTLFAW